MSHFGMNHLGMGHLRAGRSGMDHLFEVLVEPNRRYILDLLRDGEHSVGAMVDHLGISQSGVSRHLRILRDAGLVHVRTEAQSRMYRIHPEPLQDLDTWLAPYRHFWNQHLDALERHLDSTSEENS